MTCYQVINCLLKTYVNKDVISESEADIVIFKQRAMMITVFSKVLYKEALRCVHVHVIFKLKEIRIGV